VAADVGIEAAQGGLRPSDKLEAVEALQRAGRRVLFVGDGANDAPAMAAATVGVAMGDGAHAAVSTADIVVLDTTLEPIRAARQAALEVERALLLNARVSITYNISAVLVAAAGFMTPLLAAVLMPLSSLLVVSNALAIERRVARALAAPSQPEPSAVRAPALAGAV